MKTNTTSAPNPPVVAYDYDRQTWVSGAEAVELRRSQLARELALLTGPDAKRYWAFSGGWKPAGKGVTLAEAIVIVRGKLYDLPAVGGAVKGGGK